MKAAITAGVTCAASIGFLAASLPSPAAAETAVATVAGESISRAELEKSVRPQLSPPEIKPE